MKKKALMITVVAALLLALALPALAADDNPAMTWFKQRMEAKKAYVDQAVQSGQMTQEQGDTWKAHFDYMVQFHEKNGFACPGMGMGRMGGGPGNGPNDGQGFRGGMMRGQGFGPGWQGTQNTQ